MHLPLLNPMLSRLALAAMLLWASSSQAATYEAVWQKLLHAYGGEQAIRSVNTLQQTGVTFSQARQVEGALIREFRFPDAMRIAIAYPDQPEERVLRGSQAFKNGKPANPAFKAAAVLQAARLMLPRLLLEQQHKLQWHNSNHAGQTQVELSVGDNLKVVATIDNHSGHIVHSEGSGHWNGMPLSFATDYEDFRHVDGQLIAFKEHHYAMGNLIGHSTLSSVKFNGELALELTK